LSMMPAWQRCTLSCPSGSRWRGLPPRSATAISCASALGDARSPER